MEAIEKIEKYIEGKLSGEALSQFENQLKTDPQLKKDVEELRTIIEEIKKAGEKSFAAKVQEWENKAQFLEQAENVSKEPVSQSTTHRAKEDSAPEPGAGPGFNWVYVAIPTAAAAILLVFWLLPTFSGPAPSQLYADNFSAYPDLYTNMGDIQDDRQRAIAPYNEENYEAAVESFEQFLQQYPNDQLAKLYLAISLIESQEIEKGMNTLDLIIADENNNFREAAQWYKALSYLKLDDLEACKNQLKIIEDLDGHNYQSRATKLLAQLK